MTAAYDPTNYETWPEEQKDFAGRVWRGLQDGNLQPLADYLRAGHYIDRVLAKEIADAIEGGGNGLFRIVPKGRRPGQRGFTAITESHDSKLEVGVWMESRIREFGRGGYEAALEDTKARFGLGKRTIEKAHKYLREYLTNVSTKPGYDAWKLTCLFYPTP